MPRTPSRPFAVDNHELQQVERFCAANNLDVLGRICAELRLLRAEYIRLSERVGRQSNTIAQVQREVVSMEADPNRRYAAQLDTITSIPKEELACPANPSKAEGPT